jgi:hypothetical protein
MYQFTINTVALPKKGVDQPLPYYKLFVGRIVAAIGIFAYCQSAKGQ